MLPQRFSPETVAMAVFAFTRKSEVAAAGDLLLNSAQIRPQFVVAWNAQFSVFEIRPHSVREFRQSPSSRLDRLLHLGDRLDGFQRREQFQLGCGKGHQEKPAVALLRPLRRDLEMSGGQVNNCPVVWTIQGATGAAGPEHVDDDLAGRLWRRDSGVLIPGRREPAMADLPQLERYFRSRSRAHSSFLGSEGGFDQLGEFLR